MPLLDVSELLDDPYLVETITVIRREEVVGDDGRASTIDTIIPDIVASVQPKDTVIGGNVILREADYEIRGSNLNVYTKFRLRSVAEADAKRWKPDVIIWNGDHFLVALVNDFSHYGDGYIHAEVESTEMVDFAPGETL